MNDQVQNARPRRRVLLAVVLSSLAAAVALPAGAALAGGGEGGNGGNGGNGGSTLQPVQQEQAPDRSQPRPDGHPCPEDEQGGGDSSTTATPEV
jgi:hypothetical protein